MQHDTEKYRQIFESMPPEEIEDMNRKNDEEHQNQANAFKAGYEKDICHLCNKPFKTISKDTPCLHWLLRQCKFKKKDFPKIYAKYGYGNIAAFVRWCANQEKLLSRAEALEISVIIPRRKNSIKGNKGLDWHLYNLRHLVENAFARLKHYRAVATRYDKLTRNYESIVSLACAFLWLPM